MGAAAASRGGAATALGMVVVGAAVLFGVGLATSPAWNRPQGPNEAMLRLVSLRCVSTFDPISLAGHEEPFILLRGHDRLWAGTLGAGEEADLREVDQVLVRNGDVLVVKEYDVHQDFDDLLGEVTLDTANPSVERTVSLTDMGSRYELTYRFEPVSSTGG